MNYDRPSRNRLTVRQLLVSWLAALGCVGIAYCAVDFTLTRRELTNSSAVEAVVLGYDASSPKPRLEVKSLKGPHGGDYMRVDAPSRGGPAYVKDQHVKVLVYSETNEFGIGIQRMVAYAFWNCWRNTIAILASSLLFLAGSAICYWFEKQARWADSIEFPTYPQIETEASPPALMVNR